MKTKMTKAQIKDYARRYIKVVYWSAEDKMFIGSLPEICGPCCDGKTEEEVFSQLSEIAYEMVMDKLEGLDYGSIPEPGNLTFIVNTRSNNSQNSASRVAQIRKSLNVSQSVFAEMLGVSRYTVLKWEKGTRKPEGASARLLEIAATHPETMLHKV